MRAAALPGPGWRAAGIGLIAGFCALVALFWQAAAGIVQTWYSSSTFNHGFLVLPICGYLVWLRRGRLAEVAPRPDFRGLAFIVFCMLVWLPGYAASVLIVQQFALVGMVQGLVVTVIGWRAATIVIFPMFYLLFAVPAGEFLVPPLQDLTATMTVEALRLVGIPVYRDGVFLSTPTGNFEVAEACSGVRFLIATTALGFLFANLIYRTLWRRALFVALAVAIPVVANGFRAFGIVYLAYATNNELAVGVDHIVYGWIFFAFVTVLLLLAGMTFRDRDADVGTGPAPAAAGPARPRSTAWIAAAALSAVAVAAVAPAYAEYVDNRDTGRPGAALTPPGAGGGWRLMADYRDTWRPRFLGADDVLLRTYVKNGQSVHLYIAYYTHQRQGAEIISRRNSLVGHPHWGRASGGEARAVVEGRPMTVETTRLVSRGRRRMVWSWHWIGGRFASDRLRSKMLEARAKLLGELPAAATVAIAADYQDLPSEATVVLRDFLRSTAPISAALDRRSGAPNPGAQDDPAAPRHVRRHEGLN